MTRDVCESGRNRDPFMSCMRCKDDYFEEVGSIVGSVFSTGAGNEEIT